MPKTTTKGGTFVNQPKPDDRPRFAVAPNGLEPVSVTEQEKNITAHGFASPREHFINSPADFNLNQLAIAWGYDAPTVYAWEKRGKWKQLREAKLAVTPVEQGGQLATVDLTARREAFVEQEVAILEQVREKLEAEIKRPTVEQVSPAGGMVEIRKSARDIKVEVSAASEWSDRMRIALGMPTKMTGVFAGANVNAITQIMVEKPAGYVPRELPEPKEVEGVVVNG